MAAGTLLTPPAMEQEGDEVLAGGSLTLGCPCLADLVSCLVRGTHYTQEHIR